MVISASRRTDIPAFYGDWFFNRLRDGYVLVRNPMRFHQVSHIPLNPDAVDFLVFWTKNPAPFLPRLDLLADYDYGFQYTITGYGRRIEPGVPSRDESVETFRSLSTRIGPQRMIWRYDPILLHPDWPVQAHLENFRKLAEALAGFTHRCVISFVDVYPSGAKALAKADVLTAGPEAVAELAPYLSETAACFGMTVEACAEGQDLSKFGIRAGHCIDPSLTGVPSRGKDRNQRESCGCQPSVDIGAYHSCAHRCVYCYANHGEARLKANLKLHDPSSPLLIGHLMPDDKVTRRKVTPGKVTCRNVTRRKVTPGDAAPGNVTP